MTVPPAGGRTSDLLIPPELEPKDRDPERLGFSPDAGDALALTFAETVRRERPATPLRDTADYDYRVFGG